mmetsp:Transcript_3861/g.15327  ORF Transcript_3861/g.15327 Transcript_3861/m.15327 type:complete len:266 (-) Transcript_3861:522-1319(-)
MFIVGFLCCRRRGEQDVAAEVLRGAAHGAAARDAGLRRARPDDEVDSRRPISGTVGIICCFIIIVGRRHRRHDRRRPMELVAEVEDADAAAVVGVRHDRFAREVLVAAELEASAGEAAAEVDVERDLGIIKMQREVALRSVVFDREGAVVVERVAEAEEPARQRVDDVAHERVGEVLGRRGDLVEEYALRIHRVGPRAVGDGVLERAQPRKQHVAERLGKDGHRVHAAGPQLDGAEPGPVAVAQRAHESRVEATPVALLLLRGVG